MIMYVIHFTVSMFIGSSTSVEMRVQLSDTTGHLSCVTDEDANKGKNMKYYYS